MIKQRTRNVRDSRAKFQKFLLRDTKLFCCKNWKPSEFMTLRCPFCDAPEDGRIEGTDEKGTIVILLMFDCPFYLRVGLDVINRDENRIQEFLSEWRKQYGDEWLENVGPVMKDRELRNMQRKSGHLSTPSS